VGPGRAGDILLPARQRVPGHDCQCVQIPGGDAQWLATERLVLTHALQTGREYSIGSYSELSIMPKLKKW